MNSRVRNQGTCIYCNKLSSVFKKIKIPIFRYMYHPPQTWLRNSSTTNWQKEGQLNALDAVDVLPALCEVTRFLRPLKLDDLSVSGCFFACFRGENDPLRRSLFSICGRIRLFFGVHHASQQSACRPPVRRSREK